VDKNSAIEAQSRIFSEVFNYSEIAGAQSASLPEAPIFVPPIEEIGTLRTFKSDPNDPDSGLQENLRVGMGLRSPRSGSSSEDHAIILLCQEERDLEGEIVSRARDIARGEVVALYTGPVIVDQRTFIANAQLASGLEIGASVGHVDISAGTIGAFVEVDNEGPYILSNNHVLANTNTAMINDPIISPGKLDGGTQPQNVVATLSDFIPLDLGTAAGNDVDAALARVMPDINVDRRTIRGGPTGAGSIQFLGNTSVVFSQEHVWKVGRTTNWTDGNVLSLNQSVTVRYDVNGGRQFVHFAGQISIEGSSGSFSRGGDSGSMVLNDDNDAVGLLFSGTNFGGSNGGGISYANPMIQVLARLGAAF